MRAILIVILSALVAGCDPGWGYHPSPQGAHTSATTFPVADSSNLSLRLIRARLFGGGLQVRVAVTNAAVEGLTLDSGSLQIFDRHGNPLERNQPVVGCGIGNPEARLRTCTPEGYFSVNPMSRFFRRNQALQDLTVRVEGIAQDGRHVILNLPLTWDN
jgi:hypothetical protein